MKEILLRIDGGQPVYPEDVKLKFPEGYQPQVGDEIFQDFFEIGDYNRYRIVKREIYNQMYSGGDETYFRPTHECLVIHVESFIKEGT